MWLISLQLNILWRQLPLSALFCRLYSVVKFYSLYALIFNTARPSSRVLSLELKIPPLVDVISFELFEGKEMLITEESSDSVLTTASCWRQLSVETPTPGPSERDNIWSSPMTNFVNSILAYPNLCEVFGVSGSKHWTVSVHIWELSEACCCCDDEVESVIWWWEGSNGWETSKYAFPGNMRHGPGILSLGWAMIIL